jgi:hypothetical protein
MPANIQIPNASGNSSVDDSLYQIFSGAQRTNASAHIEKTRLRKLIKKIVNAKHILGLTSLALFIILAVVSLSRGSRGKIYAPITIISSEPSESGTHNNKAAS